MTLVAMLLFVFLTLAVYAVCTMKAREQKRPPAIQRLEKAAASIGEPAFTRPIVGKDAEDLDRLAAAMARRHDELHRSLDRGALAEEALQATFQALYGPALLLDDEGRVRGINPSATKAFQITQEEAFGRPFLQVLRDHNIGKALEETLAEGKSSSVDADVYATARPARYRVRIEPIRPKDGGPLRGAVMLLFDVTRLRFLERVRREFVANVSHELRTPVTSIKGFVETLLDDDVPEETEKRFLNIVKEEAERLETLVADLLDLSLLESDASPLQRQDVDLEELAREVLEMLRPQASKKSIETEVRFAPNLPPVPADRSMLEQALINLVDNAVKYTPEGGRIWIEARRVALDYIELVIADNGPGIASEHLPRLFERFYRVDKARSRAEGGTGLGLAIVQHIVLRHGGSVRAESRLGKGSRFIVTLPFQAAEGLLPDWADLAD